ncbi:MAG TPA: DinB family protein [Chitinophagaceae bacterium]|nr:DinB family protein [Chitinophagaceae bacterium]
MKFNLQKALPILERTPAIVAMLLKDLDEEWIYSNEGEETWSPFDVVGHYIHGEKTDWIPRLNIILGDQDDKRFVPFDRFAQFRDSKGKSLDELLDEFAMLRRQNIEKLKQVTLNEKTLSQTGIHPAFGVVTLEQLLSSWVVHDLGHISQITRVLAKQYKEAVGPWTAYMGILNR